MPHGQIHNPCSMVRDNGGSPREKGFEGHRSITMAGILSLKPEDEKRLLPEALEWFYAQRNEIMSEVPLEELSDDDLNAFLSYYEKCEFQSCMEEISRGLTTCIGISQASPDPLVNAETGLTVLKFELSLLTPMRRMRSLLKSVHQRKIAKAEQEQRDRDEEEKRLQEQAEAERIRKEEEERWQAAHEAVSPPLADARTYLNDEEYDEFTQSTRVAIEVYLEKGEDYLDDLRTLEYRWCLKKISDRKEKERQIIVANFAAQEYNQSLIKEMARLKALLCPKRKDHEVYFKKQIKDRRYTGQSFTQFLCGEKERAFDQIIIDISREKLDEIVADDFRPFIDSECRRSYFLLPSAEYSLEVKAGAEELW